MEDIIHQRTRNIIKFGYNLKGKQTIGWHFTFTIRHKAVREGSLFCWGRSFNLIKVDFNMKQSGAQRSKLRPFQLLKELELITFSSILWNTSPEVGILFMILLIIYLISLLLKNSLLYLTMSRSTREIILILMNLLLFKISSQLTWKVYCMPILILM